MRLGEVASAFLERSVLPLQGRFGAVAEVWGELLPAQLGQHCRIDDVRCGRLRVVVDCPTYANELRWCGAELVKELSQRCPQARIKEIKFVVGCIV